MSELKIQRFEQAHESRWNQFVANSKNGTFLLTRSFIDYHKERFEDHSLLVLQNDRIIAVLPANQKGTTLISHGGLTYGGFVTDSQMRADLMLDIFEQLIDYSKLNELSHLIYKPIPHFYHRHGAEEDLYALFRISARQIRVDISSAIKIPVRLSFSKSKRQGVRVAKNAGVVVRESEDWHTCWSLLEKVLEMRHGVVPTHTLAEIQLLKARFPANIKLFGAFLDQEMVSAIVVFDCGPAIHIQYIASGTRGREICGVDFIVDHLIVNVYNDRQWFDFGISTEDQGRHLNVGLARQKEMFGASGIIYQQFEIAF